MPGSQLEEVPMNLPATKLNAMRQTSQPRKRKPWKASSIGRWHRGQRVRDLQTSVNLPRLALQCGQESRAIGIRLTFDMSGGFGLAQPAQRRPLDGGVRLACQAIPFERHDSSHSTKPGRGKESRHCLRQISSLALHAGTAPHVFSDMGRSSQCSHEPLLLFPAEDSGDAVRTRGGASLTPLTAHRTRDGQPRIAADQPPANGEDEDQRQQRETS
jgi:hypothetical protein